MKWIYSAKRTVVLSAVIGGTAVVGGWAYLTRIENRIRHQYSMTTVLQTRKYIKEGRAVDPSMVEESPIPSAYLPPLALQKKSDLVNAQGEPLYKTRLGLLKGDALSKSRLVEAGAATTFAWSLQPGQTALTLKLSHEHSVAALVQPGDFVNVYCTLDQQPGVTADQTRMLLSHVPVIAVDEKIGDDAAPAPKHAESTMPLEQHFVTLALSPEDAGLATLAADKGRIVLTLISPLETQIHKMRPLKLADVK